VGKMTEKSKVLGEWRAILLIAGIGLILAVALFFICGCSDISSIVKGEIGPVAPYDEDGDGLADTIVRTEADGTPKLNLITGKVDEVPNARAAFEEAKGIDEGLGMLLQTIGVPFGLGGIGLLVGRLKPTQRAKQMTTLFETMVGTVDKYRHSKEITPKALAEINALLMEVNSQIKGMDDAVAKAKLVNKAAA